METLGFVLPVLEKDAHWLEQNFRAIRAMNPRPTRVVVVANGPLPFTGIEKALDTMWKETTKVGYIQIHSHPDGAYGLPHAINKGLEMMGDMDWCAMLSADDAPMPHYYADLLRGIQEMPDADVVSVGAMSIDKDGNEGCGMPASPMRPDSNPAILGTSPFRRAIWEKVGGMDETTPIFDGAFWIDAVNTGAKVKVMPGMSWWFRERPDSYSHQVIYPQREKLWKEVLQKRGMA